MKHRSERCDFPAMELLQLKGRINGNCSDRQFQPNIRWSTAQDLLERIDRMRLEHEQATGCRCWQEAKSRAAQGLASLTSAATTGARADGANEPAPSAARGAR